MVIEKTVLIKKVKSFLDNSKFELYPEKNSIFYPACYISFIGSCTLLKILNIKSSKTKNFLTILKDISYGIKYINYQIFKKEKLPFYNKIFFTWALDDNFKKDGSLHDRYLNINSKKIKNTLWFVIFLGKNKPKKINSNIVLIFLNKKIGFNFYSFIKFFVNRLIYLIYGFTYFLNSVSNFNFFAEIFLKESKQFLRKDLKLVFMPFEGQPFQNKLILNLKKNFKNIRIIGYIHSPPLPLPTNFIFRKDTCPDKLVLNSNDQLYCFSKYLGWRKSSLKVLNSFRFLKNSKKKSVKTIFLPVEIKNPQKVIKNLKILVKKRNLNITSFFVKNHPANNSSPNKKLINYINHLKSQKINLNNKNNFNYLIFIGNSGAIIEALERGSKVIHICENDIFDSFSNKLYPNLIVKKISENIYEYKIKKKQQLIKFGSLKNNLSVILNLIKY